MYENRTLVRGDNLDEMRRFPDECIDLIATDPPFNSNRNYFVPFRDEHGQEPDTLIRAFTDTWTWGEAAEDERGPYQVDNLTGPGVTRRFTTQDARIKLKRLYPNTQS